MDETDVHYPPAGTGLNHPAVLTCYHITPPEGVSFEEFQKYVQDETARMGAKFRGLDKNGGIWEIEVPHFTRYGLGCGVKRSRGNDEIVETVRKVKPPMKSMSRDRAREMAAVSASVQKTPWVARSPLHALLETILGETEVPRGWELEGTPGWPAICAENALFCGSGENVAKPRPLEIVSFPAGIALLEVLRDHVTVVEEDETPLVALMDASSASHALRSFIEVAETERDSFHMLLFELIRALFAPISGDGNPDDFRLRLLSRFAQRALSLSRPNFPPSPNGWWLFSCRRFVQSTRVPKRRFCHRWRRKPLRRYDKQVIGSGRFSWRFSTFLLSVVAGACGRFSRDTSTAFRHAWLWWWEKC